MTRARAGAMAAALALVAPGAGAAPVGPHRTDDEALRKALGDEMARAMKELQIPGEPRPHHIVYTITDYQFSWLNAVFGARTSHNTDIGRNLRIELRVGDRKSDSGNFTDPAVVVRETPMTVTLEDDYGALRRELWLRTDEAYKRAVEALARKRAVERNQAKDEEEGAENFAAAKAASTVHVTEGAKAAIDGKALTDAVIKLSAVFREHAHIHSGRAGGRQDVVRTRVLTSDGLWRDERRSFAEIFVNADAQADDGMPVRSGVVFTAATVGGFPPYAEMEKATRQLATDLGAARKAAIPDGGNAVVLFEPRAAGQVLRRMLGDHLTGTPPPRSASTDPGRGAASDLASKLNQRIAPPFFQVYDDPRSDVGPGKAFLFGAYRADEEGVPAQRVDLVDRGFLKSLLMSRTPRKELAASNGHGRGRSRQGAVRAAPGVLYVEAGGGAGLPDQALRARALKEARAAGGNTTVYLVRHIDQSVRLGSEDTPVVATFGRRPGSTVRPLLIYRLRPDGKEEPVRGISFNDFLPRSLRDLVAMGKAPHVHNYLDDELPWQGGAPATVVAPALLFRDVEVRKDTGKHPRPPLYPHPHFAATK